MTYIFISIAIAMNVFQNFCSKKCSDSIGGISDAIIVNVLRGFLCGILALLGLMITGTKIIIDLPTLLISILSAVSLGVCLICTVMALKEGAIVLINVFGTAGLIIPCIAGWFLFDEKFTFLQFVGVIILIIAMLMLVGYNTKLKGKTSPKLIVLSILALISNGFVMLSQKMFTSYVPNGSVYTFTFLSFGITAILLLLAFKPMGGNLSKPLPIKKTWHYILGLAISIFLINQLITNCSATISSILLFPMFNGLGLVFSTIMSAILFKEKMTKQGIIGMFLSLVGLVIINGIF
ncbi:MAG: DMT family transporter [Oscillospiraceae bacterium]